MAAVHTERKVGWPVIQKAASDFAVVPNLLDYTYVRSTFTWEGARQDSTVYRRAG